MSKKGHEHSVEVTTQFKVYQSPLDLESSIDSLLRLTTPKYLVGLDRVVLRDGAGLSREQVLAERKIGKSRACYHKARNDQRAWIELYVDRIFDGQPQILLRMRWYRERVLGDSLFHEIGHHIDTQIEPQFGDAERIAERWKRQLFREYTPRRLGRLMLLRPQRPPVRWIFKATVLTIRWLAARLR